MMRWDHLNRWAVGTFRRLHREDGGIATYVAQSVMIMAVLGVAFLVIAASSNMGRFIVDKIYNFMTHAPK